MSNAGPKSNLAFNDAKGCCALSLDDPVEQRGNRDADTIPGDDPTPLEQWPPPLYPQSADPNPKYPTQVRGDAVLALGILSLVFSVSCFGVVFLPFALIMASNGLTSIRTGRADPKQYGSLVGALICAGLGTAVWILKLALTEEFLPGHPALREQGPVPIFAGDGARTQSGRGPVRDGNAAIISGVD